MHERAYEHGRLFFELYWREAWRDVVELGSMSVNGSLRDHSPTGARYMGLDWSAGPGVDLVVQPDAPLPLPDASADVVLSSSAFEHDPCFWQTFLELVRLLRPGGLLYLNVPSNNWFHRHPVDCWRFYPDAGAALAKWSCRSGLQVRLMESFVARPGPSGWADFVAIFRRSGDDAAEPILRRGTLASRTEWHNGFDAESEGLLRHEAASFDMQARSELQARCDALAQRAAAAEAELSAAYAAIEALKAQAVMPERTGRGASQPE